MIVLTAMLRNGAPGKESYDAVWWLRGVAHIHSLLASYYVDINPNNWSPGDSVFDEAIHVKGEGARQLSQCLGSLPDHDTTIFSPAFDQGSSRP
jgi:hypothetical protein